MNDGPKKISRETYLQALGVFTFARSYEEKVQELTDVLEELLGVPNDQRRASHFSDAMWSYGPVSFDDALRKEHIVVDDPLFPKAVAK